MKPKTVVELFLRQVPSLAGFFNNRVRSVRQVPGLAGFFNNRVRSVGVLELWVTHRGETRV